MLIHSFWIQLQTCFNLSLSNVYKFYECVCVCTIFTKPDHNSPHLTSIWTFSFKFSVEASVWDSQYALNDDQLNCAFIFNHYDTNQTQVSEVPNSLSFKPPSSLRHLSESRLGVSGLMLFFTGKILTKMKKFFFWIPSDTFEGIYLCNLLCDFFETVDEITL